MPGSRKRPKARVAAKLKPPIDPADSPKIALSGQIVTMDAAFQVYPKGTVYLENGSIVAVTKAGDAVPTGFEGVKVVETGGTIFPGFIELHNHLAYNILRLWN